MNRLIVIIFFIGFYSQANSQEYFSKTYFTEDSIVNRGVMISSIEDDLYVLTGKRCENFTVDCGDIFRINPEGESIWMENYSGVEYNFRPLLLNDNEIITIGYDNLSNTSKWYFIKTDLNGTNISVDTFDYSESYNWINNIGVGRVGDRYVSYSFGRTLMEDDRIMNFTLLNNDGSLDTIYDKQFHPQYAWMIDVREDFSGDMVFLVNNYFENNPLQDERRIVRMNREGEITWKWSTGTQDTERQPNAFEVHPNGSYLFVQHDLQSDPLASRRNPYIFNVDTTGTLQWIKQIYPGGDLNSDIITVNEMTVAENGDILLVGNTAIWIDLNLGYHPWRGYIARLNEEGEILWEKNIFDRYENGNQKEGFLYDIVVMEDGSIAVTGIQDRIEGEPWADMWVVKLSPDGCLNTPNCGDTLDISTAVLEIDNVLVDYSFSPNPSTGIFQLKLSEAIPKTEDLEIMIYNQSGQILNTLAFEQGITIDLTGHPDGQYFYSLLKKGEVLDSGVLVKME